MAKYIALSRGQIPVSATPVKRPEMTGRRQVIRIVEAGEVFDYDGKPGKWMQPYDGSSPEKPRGRPRSRNESGQTDQAGSQVPESQGRKADDGTH